MHALADGAEDVVLVDAELAGLLEGVGEEVQEELRVGRGVDVAVTVVVEVVPQVVGVGQVAVLFGGEGESIRTLWGADQRRSESKGLACPKTMPYGELT